MRGRATFVGRWQLVERLGAGGMGEAWLAESSDGARVVVKRVRPDLVAQPLLLRQLAHEARLLARLRHPNIVALLEVAEDGTYLVMEHVAGHTVAELLRACRAAPPPPEVGAHTVREVCRALAYAHQLGILHRDVSPSNVMIAGDGAVKLLDFGIGKALDDPLHPPTATGIVKGKRGYLAPERFAGGAATPASDLYAAGVLLWELLTARRLFEDKPASVAPPPSRFRPSLDPRFDAICARALAPSPEARFASAEELAGALAQPRSRFDARALAGFVASRLDGTEPPARRRPLAVTLLVAALIVVAALVVGAALGVWWHARHP